MPNLGGVGDDAGRNGGRVREDIRVGRINH